MDKIVERVFRLKRANPQKLNAYGFLEEGGRQVFHGEIMDGQFLLTVTVGEETAATLLDAETGDPYTLHLVESAEGSFVGEVRSAYEDKLLEIANACFETQIFRLGQTERVIAYVREKYGDELEFLWEDYDAAIWRRKDNRKWYAIIMLVSRRKLGQESDEVTEIIDLRMPPEVLERSVDGKRLFRGYHMNKKHWVTACLDGTLEDSELFALIDNSYLLAKK